MNPSNLSNPHHAKKKALELRRALRRLGVERGLAACQNAVSRTMGYHSLSELVVAARNPDAPPRRRENRDDRKAWVPILAESLDVPLRTAWLAVRSTMPAMPAMQPHEVVAVLGRIPDAPPSRYGVAIFDEPKSPDVCWASRAGWKAVRTLSPDDLDPSVIWLTNADHDVFFARTDLHSKAHLRHSMYMDVSPSGILAEHGRDADQYDAVFVAELAAMKFASVMETAEGLLAAADVATEGASNFVGRTLRRDLSVLVRERPPMEDVVLKRIDPTGYATTLVSMPERGETRILFRPDRGAHARKILEAVVGDGPYEFFDRRDMAGDPAGWIAERRGRVMVCAKAGRLDDAAEVFGYGRGAGVAERWKLPELVTGEEFTALRGYGDLEPDYALVHASTRTAASLLGEPARRFVERASGWEKGVVAQCLWRATMIGDVDGKRSQSAVAPWTAAADKAAMIGHVRDLQAEGYVVRSYGHGWIRTAETTTPPSSEMLDRLGLSVA